MRSHSRQSGLLCDVAAPQHLDTVVPELGCTTREYLVWRAEQKSFMYLQRVLEATEGWKRKYPGQMTAWEGPGYDFEPYFVREKAGLPVTLDIEEDPVLLVETVKEAKVSPKQKLTVFQRVKSVVKSYVSGIVSAITSPKRTLRSLFGTANSQKRSAMKKSKPEEHMLQMPGAWPDQPKSGASAVAPRKKKSVSFSAAPKESCTVHVSRWINVTRDEWASA